jgi:methyl-accepting chemotaxis protein
VLEQQIKDNTALQKRQAEELKSKVDHILEVVQAVARGDRSMKLQITGTDAVGQLAEGLRNSFAAIQAYETRIHQQADLEKQQAEELRLKIDQILVAVNALAAGDFTYSVPNLGTDDIGQVAQSLNQAIRAVHATLQGVREVADQVATAAQHLSVASEDIAKGAQEQASSLEETASTLEEITATVKQNSERAQQARQLASGSRDVAENGGQVVGTAVEAMGAINQSSKRIADIITTIDEIAFQTNLLALNAAVEAARAGEQGRGFAVVASEVRNLAQRSATAAKEIKQLIQDSVHKVENGTDLVNKSGQTLQEIVTSVKRVTDIVTEIAGASREQSAGVDQVNKAVTQMDSVTQRNASQTEEMSATAQTLTNQAEQLLHLVAQFKLQDGSLSSAAKHRARPTERRTRSAFAPSRREFGSRNSVHDGMSDQDGFQEF